jgi:catalase-peroxidase
LATVRVDPLAEMLVDRESNLTLTVPEMTVLVGSMRALNANAGQTAYGVFTDRLGTLTNEFFVNLLDMSTQWSKPSTAEGIFEGHDRKTGTLK